MPTNQSSPWGGGALQACSDAERPTAPVSAHAKTVKANKVPFSQTPLELSKRQDPAKSFPSNVTSAAFPLRQTVALSGLSVWENGDGSKINTQSQFTAVPDGSPTLPQAFKGFQIPNRLLVAGLEQAGNSLTETKLVSSMSMRECQDGFNIQLHRCASLQTSQPGNGSGTRRGQAAGGDALLGLEPYVSNCDQDVLSEGKPAQLQNNAVVETALPLQPVPPTCLTLHRHQGAALGKDASSLHSTALDRRSTKRGSASTRRCQSAKPSSHFSPTYNDCPAITSGCNQLMVTGSSPAKLTTANGKLQKSLNENKRTSSQRRPRTTVSMCRRVSASVARPSSDPRPAVAATEERQPSLHHVTPGTRIHCSLNVEKHNKSLGSLVGCVANQISAIHLTKQGQAALASASDESQLSGPQSLMQVDGAEEELPDELENANSDDDESDCSSIDGTSSKASLHSSIEEPMSVGAEDDREERPALVPSLFPFIPPTLYFSTANEKVELLPAEQRRLLKWKMSTVTPNVVKHTIGRSHFKVTKKSHDWLGCWGHHMKSLCFKAIGEHQKLNHFPGTFQIGRKDRLWRNLSKMQVRFGKREFNFFPRTFILPQDIKLLRKAWEDGGSRQKWIIKPPASARGIGIQVIHKWSQMPRKRPLLVQKYLHKPYLISGNKFDLRIYVYVTSYDPLRVYIFTDGLVRFASCKYSSSMKTLSNKFIHLTNYSVNKKNSEYQTNSDDKACQGHKWALKALWQYLGSRGISTNLIWEKIKDIVIKTIIASEPYVNSLLKMHVRSPYSCHELFGFDIMLDENLKPWILEVNISPSLHSNTALDVSIKGQMIRDVLNLAGFHIPQKDDVVAPCSSTSSSTSSLSGGKRERSKPDLSPDEKVKRAFYLTQRYAEQDFLCTVLDVLTPDDVRVLAESEDELSRRGEFERIFPSATSSRYQRFFECPRYLNILLDQWEQKYWSSRTKGLSLLRSLCQEGIHLGTSDPAHIWSKCSHVHKSEPPRQDLSSPSRSGVVVSHQHRPLHDDDDDAHGSDRELPSVSSLPVSPSPGSSATSSACSSPQPSLSQSSPAHQPHSDDPV